MLNDVTLLVKAFERPDSVVALYKSLRLYYPSIPIVIVDDGNNKPPQDIFDENVKYINAEYNIGVSAGRNLALSHITTEYFVLLDDDFIFTEHTKLENMLEVLETTDIDIVSGIMHDFGKIKRSFAGCFDVTDDVFTLRIEKTCGESGGYSLYNIVLNFFMARTEKIKKIKWDPELKTGEHKEFFIRARAYGIKCTVLESVTINHFPEQLGNYAEYRSAAAGYEALAFEKHGIHEEIIIEPLSFSKVGREIKTFFKKSSFLVAFVHFLKKKMKCYQ